MSVSRWCRALAVHGGDSEEESSSTIMAENQGIPPSSLVTRLRELESSNDSSKEPSGMSFDPNNEVSEVVKIRSRRRRSMAFTMIRAARSVDSTIQEGGLRR